MSAARILLSRRRPWIGLAAAATACSLIPQRPSRITLDSPASTTLPQDQRLVSHGRRLQNQFEITETREEATKRGDSDLINEASDPDTYSPAFEDDDHGSWAQFSRNFDTVIQGLKRIQWGGWDKVVDYVPYIPSWAIHIPEGIQKLQFELSMEPGTLADDIWQEAHDPEINPEILWDARVRISNSLSQDELSFRARRKQHIRKAFAKYIGVGESDVDPDDIPTIAMCGSGGGLRALVAGTSSYISAQEAGLFDCVTYTAGVSGSCWLQTLFFSSLGKTDTRGVLKHIKDRIGVHIAFPPTALKLATSAPTSKFILSGFVEKLKGDPNATFGLVDVYSMLLGLRLLVPKGDLDVHPEDLKLSNQRRYMEDGQAAMPIYTLVRHEIPVDEAEKEEAKKDHSIKEKVENKALREAWFQWFEMTPFEFGCEELGAWQPTWSLGRPFNEGRNQVLDTTGIALPEMRISLLLGIWGSAFTATLAHYYKEIRPILKGIAGFGGLDELLEDKDQDLVKIHPIEPATIPNYVYGLKGQLPASCPDSIFKTDHLQLMDAGMSNNLPIYPLLRQDRDVDVLIAFDASADIQKENWLSVVDGYAKQRGIKSWPIGTGFPQPSSKSEEDAKALEEARATTAQEAASKLASAREENRQKDESAKQPAQVAEAGNADTQLGHCTIWVGTKEEREREKKPSSSTRVDWSKDEDSTFKLMKPEASIAVIYFPLLPNDKVPGVDPDKSDYLSTWNFIYTPEQIDKVVELAKTNFQEGADATKRTIRAVYERKKAMREKRENEYWIASIRRKLRDSGDAFTHG